MSTWNDVKAYINEQLKPGITNRTGVQKILDSLMAIINQITSGSSDPQSENLWDPAIIYPKDTQPVFWRDQWLVSNIEGNEGTEPINASGQVHGSWRVVSASSGVVQAYEPRVYINPLEIVFHNGGFYYLDRSVVGAGPFNSTALAPEHRDGKWFFIAGGEGGFKGESFDTVTASDTSESVGWGVARSAEAKLKINIPAGWAGTKLKFGIGAGLREGFKGIVIVYNLDSVPYEFEVVTNLYPVVFTDRARKFMNIPAGEFLQLHYYWDGEKMLVDGVKVPGYGEATTATTTTALEFDSIFGKFLGKRTQAGIENYTLAAGTHKRGASIYQEFVSDGVNAINFSADFDYLYGISSGDVLAAGTYELYFLYKSNGKVTVNVPGNLADTTDPTAPTGTAVSSITDDGFTMTANTSTDN